MVSLDHLTSLLPASFLAHQERSLRNPQPTEPRLSSENWELPSLQPSPGKRAFTAVILFSSSHRGQGPGPVKYLLCAQPHAEGEDPDINQLQFLASSARQRPPTPPPRLPPPPPSPAVHRVKFLTARCPLQLTLRPRGEPLTRAGCTSFSHSHILQQLNVVWS